jgi:hypothetical protein
MADEFLKQAESLLQPSAASVSSLPERAAAAADSESEEEAMILAGDELKPAFSDQRLKPAETTATTPKKVSKPLGDDDLSAALKRKPVKKLKTSKK